MSQITVAVAIGLFGILAIFVAIKAVSGIAIFGDAWWWTKDFWKVGAFVSLSSAYLGLVALGLACYLWRRQLEAITDKYMDLGYMRYQKDLRQLANTNLLTRIIVRLGATGETAEKRRYKGIWILSVSYLVISVSLLVFIGIY
jgi:hypothetical protein